MKKSLLVPSLFSGVNSLLVSGRVSFFNYGYDCGSQYLQSLVGFFDKEKLTILAAMKSRSAHLNQTSIVGFNTVDGSEIQHSPVEVGSWNPIIYKVLYIPGGCFRFLNHQEYHLHSLELVR